MTDETASVILEDMRRFERPLGDMRLDERVTRIDKRLDLVEG